jgi:catechol 2,3-dioxygenase-like lactoylglutathione lyase family enzyme
MIKGVAHVAVSTSNLERLRKFYLDVLGFEPVAEGEWNPDTALGPIADSIIGLKKSAAKMAMVSKGGMIIEMFEYSSPEPKPIPADWRVCDHGYTHIALRVEDIDAEYERLRKAGMTFFAPPPKKAFAGIKAVYGLDPEGHLIELEEVGLPD